MSSRETTVQGIKKFDLSRLKLGNCLLVVGQRARGKSILNKDICHHFQDIPNGMIINGSETASGFYSKFFPDTFIYEDFEEEKLEDVFKLQSKKLKNEGKKRGVPPEDCKRLGNSFLFLMDDCMASAKKWKNSEQVKKLFQQGRHYNILSIVNLQYAMGLLPEQRTNVDFVFLFREDEIRSRELLWKQYAGIIPSQDIFDSLMNHYCRDHACLVIDKRSNASKWEDKVFWYRAIIHNDNFKLGSPGLWRYHDDNSRDSDEEPPEDPDVKRLKDTLHRYSAPGAKRVQIMYHKKTR